MKSDSSIHVCLIRGGQTLLADRFIKEISERFLGDSSTDEPAVFYADETKVGEVLSNASTPSMFSPRKVVVLKRAELLDKESVDIVKQYSTSPCPHVCVIFVSSDSKKPDLKVSDGVVVKQAENDPRKVFEQAVEEARALGVELKRPAAKHLCDLVGEDLAVIKSEIVKLAEIYGAGASVDVADMDNALKKRTSADVFDLVNAVADGKKGQALSILSEIASQNQTEPLFILSVVSSRIRNILRASAVKQRSHGAPAEQQKKLIAGELKIKPGAAHYIWKQTGNFPFRKSARIMEIFADADKALKTSRSGGYEILTRTVVNLFG